MRLFCALALLVMASTGAWAQPAPTASTAEAVPVSTPAVIREGALSLQFPMVPVREREGIQVSYRLRLPDSTATLLAIFVDFSLQGATAAQVDQLTASAEAWDHYIRNSLTLPGSRMLDYRLTTIAGMRAAEVQFEMREGGRVDPVRVYSCFDGTTNVLLSYRQRSPDADLQLRDAFFASLKRQR